MSLSGFNSQTLNLTQLFTIGRLTIPDYQRRYAWRVSTELTDFWRDLETSTKNDSYFMGVIILSQEEGDITVVDGQQRLIALTLLSCAICRLAKARNQDLIVDTVRSSVLEISDFESNKKIPRLALRDQANAKALEDIIEDALTARSEDIEVSENDEPGSLSIWKSYKYLFDNLKQDVDNGPSNALNRWTTFLTQRIIVSSYLSQSDESAYRIFEVVNARGKVLTPADMLRAYIIGSFKDTQREEIARRWEAIEKLFADIGEEKQITQFIRHTLTLEKGFIASKDLYRVVKTNYEGDGVLALIELLEQNLEFYLGLIDPSLIEDSQDRSEDSRRIAQVLNTLGITTVRPAVLAVRDHENEPQILRELSKIVIGRLVVSGLGTGSIEAKFANFAHAAFKTPTQLDSHLHELRRIGVDSTDFTDKVMTKNLNAGIKTVLRHSAIQKTPLPSIDFFLHLIHRDRKIQWPGFDSDEFDNLSKTIGNSVLLEVARRPRNSNTSEAIADLFGPELAPGELVTSEMLKNWTSGDVEHLNAELAEILTSVWCNDEPH